MKKNDIYRRTGVALALALVMVLVLAAPAWAASASGADRARAAAGSLMRKIDAVTAADPSDPGAAPGWKGAVADAPLLVCGLDGTPSEYIVPVMDGSGKVISTIGVGASDFRWHWYSRDYSLPRFPLVSLPEARAMAGAYTTSHDLGAVSAPVSAVAAPDRNIYWRFQAGLLDYKQVYVPAFSAGAPFDKLSVVPWQNGDGVEVNPAPPSGGGSAGGPAPGGRQAAAHSGGAPAAYNIPNVPYHQQATDYWCGPAALEMAFDYWGPDVSQSEIASVADSDRSYGVYADDLARAAQFSNASGSVQDPGLRGYSGRGLGYGQANLFWSDGTPMYDRRYSDLKSLVSQDYPLLVLTYYDGTHASGHFRLVKGYSDASDSIVFHDPWYAGTGPHGPDQVENQSYFVDNLWNMEGSRWGMVTCPWGVSVIKPPFVSAGETFAVSATASYRGPSPMNGKYATAMPTATINLPAGFQLAGGDVNQPIPGVGASGTGGTVNWTVLATESQATSGISATMQGRVSGSSRAYPAYNDWIGGVGSTADVPPFSPTSRTWGHGSVGVTAPAANWYLAEGCTGQGFETWVLVQNPGDATADIDMVFQTDQGQVQGPRETLAPHTRKSYNVGAYVTSDNVSTRVTATTGQVICERAVYWNNRNGAHDSIGVNAPSSTWYLAEGATDGGFETWVLVQNPGDTAAPIDITFQTDQGQVQGPRCTVPPRSRLSFNAGAYVKNYNVSTRVTASSGAVVCERAVYWGGRKEGTDSVGVTAPARQWYMAEGSTAGGFETWVLVQNPGDAPSDINMVFQTDGGQVQGPRETVPAHSRMSYNVGRYTTTYNVSTAVTASSNVICERTSYGNNRTWGTNSEGVTGAARAWYLAEGCTGQGFETWVLVQNPNDAAATVKLTYMTVGGSFPGPTVTLAPRSRRSFNVYESVPATWQVSTVVTANQPVIAERSVYGDPH